MKKLSKIEESVWSDIHKRSNGVHARKEDDVNLLDLIDFYNYIKEQYKSKVEYIDLDAMGNGNGDVLGVDITENIILFYKPKRGHILLSWSKVKIPIPFFDELTEMFKVENPNAMRRIITEKDGSCTNKTFIDVIEFFLGHKDGLVNESVWSDIHKRSNGEKFRKEDIINDSWNLDEMFGYMIDNYKCKYTNDGFMKSTWSLTAAPFKFKNGSVFLSLKPYETYKLITCSYKVKEISSFFKELSKKYTVKKVFGGRNEIWFEIYPNGLNHEYITNTFFVEVFDYFLNFDGEGVDEFEKLIEKK